MVNKTLKIPHDHTEDNISRELQDIDPENITIDNPEDNSDNKDSPGKNLDVPEKLENLEKLDNLSKSTVNENRLRDDPKKSTLVSEITYLSQIPKVNKKYLKKALKSLQVASNTHNMDRENDSINKVGETNVNTEQQENKENSSIDTDITGFTTSIEKSWKEVKLLNDKSPIPRRRNMKMTSDVIRNFSQVWHCNMSFLGGVFFLESHAQRMNQVLFEFL